MVIMALLVVGFLVIGFVSTYFLVLHGFMKRIEEEHGVPVKQQLMKMIIRNPYGH